MLMVVRFGCGELMYDAVAVAEAEGAAAAAVITTLTSAVAALV